MPSMMPRITALTASDIMIWSVPIEIRQKSRVLLAYSNPSRNRKKTANTGCLMRRLGYSVFATDITSYEENTSIQAISAPLLISSGPDTLYCAPLDRRRDLKG